jgi:diacylglycerol O-acyltransferase / wax synthase
VQRSATAAKALYERTGQGLLADAAGLLAPSAVGPLLTAASRLRLADRIPPLANVIISNVRGPDFPLYVAGARLESMFPMGPLMEGVGLGVTVVTYRDEVGFGFVSCPDLLPDVAGLAATVPAELVSLQAAAAG